MTVTDAPNETQSSTADSRPPIVAAALRVELLGVIVPLLLLAAVLAVVTPNFYSAYTMRSIATQAGIFTVVGLAQLTAISIGQMNLALPAMSVSAGMLFGYVIKDAEAPFLVAALLAISCGMMLGAMQGALIGYLHLNPFIVTLGLASLYTGLMLGISRGASFSSFPGAFGEMGANRFIGVPYIAIYALVVTACAYLLFNKTVSGREMLAVGASPRAARFSAISVPRTILKAHACSGVLAALAALIAVADLGTVDTSLGQSWLLPSFAAPVLGGAVLTGGRVSAVGTALGAVLLVMVGTGLVTMGVNQYWYQVGLGVIVLASVLIGRARNRLGEEPAPL
jgi:ribose transport system permease protein